MHFKKISYLAPISHLNIKKGLLRIKLIEYVNSKRAQLQKNLIFTFSTNCSHHIARYLITL